MSSISWIGFNYKRFPNVGYLWSIFDVGKALNFATNTHILGSGLSGYNVKGNLSLLVIHYKNVSVPR